MIIEVFVVVVFNLLFVDWFFDGVMFLFVVVVGLIVINLFGI